MGFNTGGGASQAALAALQTQLNNHIANQSAGVHGTEVAPANLLAALGGGEDNFTNLGNKTGAVTVDLASGNVQKLTATGNVTVTFSNTTFTMSSAHVYTILLLFVQDGTGSRTLTVTNATWLTGSPTPDPNVNALSTFLFYTPDAGTTWYGSQLSGQGVPVPAVELMGNPTVNGNTTLATNLNRTHSNITNQASYLTSGTLEMTPIWLTKGVTYTGAWFASGTTAFVAGTSPHQWFVLCLGDGVTIARKTADDTSTAWAAQSPKSLAFTSPYIALSDGLHYLGLCVAQTGGTLPSILANSAINANQLKVASNFGPPLTGQANTGLTDPASLVTVTARASWVDHAGPAPVVPWAGVY